MSSTPRSRFNPGSQASASSSRSVPNGQPRHPNALSNSQSSANFQHLPASLPQTVQMLISLGAERNLQASQMQGLAGSNRKNAQFSTPALTKLDRETEACWVQAGRLAETLGDWQRALSAYESALSHNPFNVEALTQTANILRGQEKFVEAAEYFTRVIHLKEDAGEVWGALGHCYLMIDDLPKAYACYQQAIAHIPDAKNEPKLWYGIGILYDRYGSLEHAEEAFASVIQTDPNFEKANEIYFRLGIIYKQQKNSADSLNCFKYILHNPPRPLTEIDIWFQIGHVYEQMKDYNQAKDAYDRVLAASPNHAKVLQQLGGLYQREGAPFKDVEKSTLILTKSLEQDSNDPFSWYLLGRAYMIAGNYGKAYEAYQQAVYRDGKNPAFWCSIGVLYYQINQFHDALDAYSRAIRINPYVAEVWHNLGALYESCNDQMNDALDAYNRSVHLDPTNETIRRRLDHINASQHRKTALSPPPRPRDISPSSDNWALANGTNPPVPPGPSQETGHAQHARTHRQDGSVSGHPSRMPPMSSGDVHHPGYANGARPSSMGGRPVNGNEDDSRAPSSRSRPTLPPYPANGAEINERRGSFAASLAARNSHGSPPLSPRSTMRNDHSSEGQPHSSRFPHSEEWERGRPALGYREQHPASPFAYAESRGPIPSPAHVMSPRTVPPLRSVSQTRDPPGPTASPISTEHKVPARKSAAARRTKVNTPITTNAPHSQAPLDGARPPNSAGAAPSSASSSGTPKPATEGHYENDQAGVDSLMALAGQAASNERDETDPARKRSLSDQESGPLPKRRKASDATHSKTPLATSQPDQPPTAATTNSAGTEVPTSVQSAA